MLVFQKLYLPKWPALTDRFSGGEKSWLSAYLILAISGIIFALNTAQGIGIFTDSTRYMGISARPYDAPLYHWLLVAGRWLGLEFTQTATVIAIITLAANILLIHRLLVRSTKIWWLPAIGTSLVVFSPQFVTLHASAMSEPLFITLLLVTMSFALTYFQRGTRSALAFSALALGLASLTRFAGPPLGAAIACIILFTPFFDTRKKFQDIGILAGISGGIFLTWVAISQLTAGRSIGRDLWFYGNMGPKEWLSSLEVMTAWIAPDQVPLMVRIPLLFSIIAWGLGYAAAALYAHAKAGKIPTGSVRPVFAIQLGLFFIFYMLFILLSVSIEANLTLTGRYALPAYVAAAMLVTLAIDNFRDQFSRSRMTFILIVIFALLVCLGHLTRTAARTPEVYRDGYGYQHISWRSSPSLEGVRQLPENAVLYSNGPDIISFHTGRTAEFVAQEYQLRTGLPERHNPISLQLDRIREATSNGPVYVVMFDRVDWRHYLASESKLIKELNLSGHQFFQDGRIYRVPQSGEILMHSGAVRPPLERQADYES